MSLAPNDQQRRLSARAALRLLRVARTMLDLDNAEGVDTSPFAEALTYRSFDQWRKRRPMNRRIFGSQSDPANNSTCSWDEAQASAGSQLANASHEAI